ncbi:MAG: hypothetical protein GY763_04265 [Gammaproteobacteria bacterium]|nr:hypothetical protein [Gammaproteobacteria bacterium]
MTRLTFIIVIGCFVLTPLQAASDAIIVRLAKVYPQASSLGKPIGQITAGTTVSVFTRKGGWKEIYSEQPLITGWVRSYQVREGLSNKSEIKMEAKSDSRGFLAGLASFSRKASGFFGGGQSSAGSAGTATIGVRGLSEEEIKNAKPDLQELEKMQGFGSDQSRMAAFVSAGELSAQKIKHLKKKK